MYRKKEEKEKKVIYLKNIYILIIINNYIITYHI